MSSPNANPVVEELAQRKFRLESILETQSAELRNVSPAKYLDAYESMQDGQPGGRWTPQDAAEKERNVRLMEEICAQTPTSIEDRTRMLLAAHGLLVYTITLDMNELPMNIQLQITRRSLELREEVMPPPKPDQAEFFQSLLKPDREILTRPSTFPPTGAVTATDMNSFENNPIEIVDMNFILHSAGDGDEGVLYKVAEFGSSKNNVWYQVQFEGCADFIQVDQIEMMDMVKDSDILAA